MIRFLAKIRNSLIPKTGLRKYTVYAVGEILLVMIGILLALQANNWNENRKERDLELQILHEMKLGLEKDVSDIDYNIDAHERILNSQMIIIDWMNNDRPYHDSLGNHFSISNNSTVFVSNEGPYATLKQLGIRMVQNDSLRLMIQEVYDLDFDYYKDHIVMYNDLVFNSWKVVNAPYFEATKFKFSNPKNTMPPLNPKELKSDNNYTYTVKTMAEFNDFYIRKIMRRAFNQGNLLIEMIDEELDDRGYYD
ncbi:MAG: hypothetical protein HKN68_13515 [Saprospiraceae bacterium]|nr:hypothetical protein [Saprospiraceae bacterium]